MPIENDDNFGITLDELFKLADHNPQIIGRFITNPSSVTIEVWNIMDGTTVVSLSSNDCYEIADTNRWAWSCGYLPPLTRSVNQFVYKMTANTLEEFSGDFILHVRETNEREE